MSFWTSELGEITGKPEDAFAGNFILIPDGTKSLSKIENMSNESDNFGSYINISWQLIDGEFKGRKINQKLRVVLSGNDDKAKYAHKRALNMLKLIYDMFGVKPKTSMAPTDEDLSIFVNKIAGIVIFETQPNHDGKQYNRIGEVHDSKDFVSQTGVKLVVSSSTVESAFSRNSGSTYIPKDDIPF